MLSVFDACVQVGRLDRASLVLKRFGNMDALPPHDLVELHNRYLLERLAQLHADPGLNKAEDLHQWFELQIRSRDLPLTADTIACMLKASLLTSHGSRLDRLVDRYMGMLPKQSALESLFMGDVLTPKDLATIAEICPSYNMPEDVSLSNLAEDTTSSYESEMAKYEAQRSEPAPAVPEVLSTPQKGMGLKMLKQTLSLFSEIPEGRDIATLSPAERREIQARLERDCVDAAIARWREENQALMDMGLNTSLASASLSSRLYDWQRSLEVRLTEEIEKVEASELAPKKSKEDLDRCIYGPFLRQSQPSRLAAVTILSTLSALAMHGADKGVPLSIVVNQVSKVAEEDIRAQIQAKSQPRNSRKTKQANPRRMMRHDDAQQSADSVANSPQEAGITETTNSNVVESSLTDKDKAWPVAIRTKVGAALLSALIQSAKVSVVREHPETKTLVSQSQPAFTHTTQLRKGKKIGMVLPNRTLVELMKREPRGDFLARHLPMVAEPEPWTKFEKGGFIEYPASLVRIKHGEKDQKIYTEAAIARGDMDQVLKGLDVLGKTAWRINRPVFDVMLEAWNTGDELANIPALNPNIPIPPEPESSEDPMQRRLWIKAVKAAENEKSGLHSVRCFMNFQLEIARAFRDQTFYFPHNIDFRGRAYPIPTYLNHMGADHVRGLLRFAKGKVLGESGLRWLKVHLANVFGYDKASLTERENFAMENLDNIIDSVNKPLTGSRWWLKAEDPWQCLATCHELKAALDCEDPTRFVSHLPVHQDGTCNGLQHYAALGGDTWGAQQVNLMPGDRPADVYSAVANLVKETIAKDVADGNAFAKAVDGKITRKVVKQTVMTNVYGVTFIGAKKQVLKQLDSLYPNLYAETGFEPIVLASYIATKIFNALSTMFRGAHDIQHWLGEIGGRVCRALTPEQLQALSNGTSAPTKTKAKKSAKTVSKAKESTDEVLNQFRSTLVWTTPLRMPVVQPYRKSGTRTISTCLQDLVLTTPDKSDPVHRRKQLQAFPPNFIHSLDASHMILSALECAELGLDFAAVHDSFWTHAADVDSMNNVIRDAFIRIHSEDVIGRLAAEFQARYKGSVYLAKVYQDTPVAKKIAAHRKKSRMSLKDELMQEKERQRLLVSLDPKEVEEGKAMVTPASIFEEMQAEADLAETEDLDQIALGKITTESSSADALEGETSLDEAVSPIEMEAATVDADSDEVGGTAEEVVVATDERQRHLESMLGTSQFAMELAGKMRKKQVVKLQTQLWLPLTFPTIPEKGNFDVRQLKGSKYFFS
ncbi:hypothetical protein QBC46DRAFT_385834 [Diplogelasinospora grovesii]|uniref:DNA-directed RNA polymerase n=1 Tax=Diplogelasinospora grovesii TaxID=303347 RepID=A0AAN6N9P9_9PEZI|nr:hypothetical protein QBC46DRAFT_385834 [Diplogelasinospora grovesii]